MADTPLADALLPAHKRRVGRIESLHEFQQRALSYDSDDNKLLASEDGVSSLDDDDVHVLDINSWYKAAGDAGGAGGRRRQAPQRSGSVSSLFGSSQRHIMSKRAFYGRQIKVLSFLILLGVIGGPLNYSIRLLAQRILSLRKRLISYSDSEIVQFVIWAAHTIVFSQLGILCTRLSPVAAGSGISQMKSILTGIDPRMYLPGYFDFSTLVAKLFGLACSVGSGLIVGTEGSYVHIMSIITHHILKTMMYQGFGTRQNARIQLLAAACAVGVASTFSSPIGGVLFSMEVTSTYYLMSNYMKAFISSVSATAMLHITLSLAESSSAESKNTILVTTFPESPFRMWEIPLFLLLGALIGAITTAMVWLLRKVAEQRKVCWKSSNKWVVFYVKWIDPILIALLTAAATFFPGAFIQTMSMENLTNLFTDDGLSDMWQHVSKYYTLALVGVVYLILLPLCITLKLPTGVWLPSFIAGAALGRLFGEAMTEFLPYSKTTLLPGIYSLAGAAACTAASTRTVSAAVIALEITGAMQVMVPVFCATLASIAVSNLWTETSVYDTLLLVSGMPYLPLLDFDSDLAAGAIVEPHLVYIPKRVSVARLLLVIQRLPGQEIPVIQSESSRILLGVVTAAQIKELIRNYYAENDIEDVEIDLGEEVKSTTGGLSWATLRDKLSSNRIGGLNGTMSYDQHYNSISLNMQNGNDGQPKGTVMTNANHHNGGIQLPFLMNDVKMMELMRQGWSDKKKDLLDVPIKITKGTFCVIRPMAMTVSSATSLDDLHMIFTMLRCDHCFVCDQGALMGVVTTRGLLEAGNYKRTS